MLRFRVLRTGHRAGESKPVRPADAHPGRHDYAVERPEFLLTVGMTALLDISNGWDYDITGIDVLDAYAAVLAAAGAAGVDEVVVNAGVRERIAGSGNGDDFVLKVLSRQLAD